MNSLNQLTTCRLFEEGIGEWVLCHRMSAEQAQKMSLFLFVSPSSTVVQKMKESMTQKKIASFCPLLQFFSMIVESTNTMRLPKPFAQTDQLPESRLNFDHMIHLLSPL